MSPKKTTQKTDAPTGKDTPFRRPLDWQNPDFYDSEKLDEEMRRAFDICHGCRRCFNLCDSFPKLFDLIDESASGELDTVDSKNFGSVTDSCTLCDLCFVNKCPYVPPHEFDLDFPHLMLRAKAVKEKNKGAGFIKNQIIEMDRNGPLGVAVSGTANWTTKASNTLTRPLLEKVMGIHRDAEIPSFAKETFIAFDKKNPLPCNTQAPGYGEKVVLYATCYGNYHQTSIAKAARAILAHNGVEVVVDYPGCCGMPKLEQGQIEKVAIQAKSVCEKLAPWVEKGYTILALVPSCSLMLKQEWPLILPKDNTVALVAEHTKDICEYLVKLFKDKGMVTGIGRLPPFVQNTKTTDPNKAPSQDSGNITLHLACHSRAQNMGNKAADLLRLIPQTKVDVIERCSGHGGAWGMMVDHFEVALKVGKPVVTQVKNLNHSYVASECPLAGTHIAQGIEKEGSANIPMLHAHPLEIFAMAYGLMEIPQ